MELSLFISLVVVTFYVAFSLFLIAGHRHICFLSDLPPDGTSRFVSVIIPARNEERHIEEALSSILMQDYPAYEVIVIDDRSTDGTSEILQRMAENEPKMRLVTVTELPAGWLGKNHALDFGAAQAAGEFFLFTDADIVMAPSTLSRAMGRMIAGRFDHLAVGPEVRMPGAMLNAFMGAFMLFFTLYVRPWDVPKSRRSAHVGIGAFNLVRAAVYRKVGGHRSIALRPDDDMKLGKIIKKDGFRQGMLLGRGMMHVEWYPSVMEAVRGLEKNAYAGLDYSPLKLVGASLAAFLLFVWPFVALFFPSLPGRPLYLAALILLCAIYLYSARIHALPAKYLAGFPPATILLIYILWRSAVLAYWRGGVVWRDTFYPLNDLKRNRV